MAEVFYIEGCDYMGKTTLITELKKIIKKNNKTVLTLREPVGDIREKLLSKTEDLTFLDRRILFLTCHMQVRERIREAINDVDYIIIDRCAPVSDSMQIFAESEMDSHMLHAFRGQLRRMYRNAIKLQQHYICDFRTHLILLHTDEDEFNRRIASRTINEDDVLDSKSKEFKFKIYNAYKELIANDDEEGILSLFDTVHVLDNTTNLTPLENASLAYNMIMKGGND